VKKLLAVTAMGAIAAVLAVPALAGTKTVTVGDNYFGKKGTTPTVTINSGSAVKWVWKGKKKHNVYELSGPIDGVHFHTPTKKSGSFKRVFHKRGTYVLVCTYHSNQKMTLKVK
jgi:plastocyanin